MKPIVTINNWRYYTINNHSARLYECGDRTFCLDKNNSALKPYYEFMEHNETSLPKRIDIDIPDGISWAKAEKIAFDYINKVCNTNSNQTK
jgi:hypothetical protein